MKRKPVNAIDSIRTEVAALQAERKGLMRQPFGPADVAPALERSLVLKTREWQERLDLALRRVSGGTSAGDAVSFLFDPENRPGGLSVDAVALIGLLGADAISGALLARLDGVVPAGPSAAERAARIAEIDRDLDRLETDEEALVVESEATGMPIARRDDCRLDIVLAIVGEAANDDMPEPTTTPAAELKAQETRALAAAGARQLAKVMLPVPSEYMKRRRD